MGKYRVSVRYVVIKTIRMPQEQQEERNYIWLFDVASMDKYCFD